MNTFLLTSIISSLTLVEEMQVFSSLVTLVHVHDFIFKKHPLMKPCKNLLKQNNQKKEGGKKITN
jgi:hypothetical protein